MSHFFNMGGYAVYVWPSYFLTALVLAGLAYESWRGYRTARQDVSRLEDDRPDRHDPL